MSQILKCPVCQKNLLAVTDQKAFACANHHSFDLAKEGYLNLLLNAKPTAGDSKEMMQARRNFLAAGYYAPLSDAVNQLISQALQQQVDPQNLVDVGCGEGYYLSRAQDFLANDKLKYFGLDISKLGIKMAAKQHKNIQWLVANFAHLPFLDGSVSLLLSMFADYSVAEMQRVLSDDGAIIFVRAGKNHLIELKNIIYPEIHEKERAAAIKPFPDFSLERQTHSFQTTIHSTEDLLSLLLMTPHYWKIKPDSLDKLRQYKELTVTVEIELDLLKRATSAV